MLPGPLGISWRYIPEDRHVLVFRASNIFTHILDATMAKRKQDGEDDGGGGFGKVDTHTSELVGPRVLTENDCST